MRKKMLLLLMLFVTLAGLPGCTGRKARPTDIPNTGGLTVISYNIRIGLGPTGKSGSDTTYHLHRIVDVIREQRADIILLQEVDRGSSRVLGLDQPAHLNDATGYFIEYSPAFDIAGGEYGIAILSRWPIEDLQTVKLFKPDYSQTNPDYPGYYSEQRLAQVCRISPPRRPALRVINTHLGLTTDQRARQLGDIVPFIEEGMLVGPVIFGGDLNAEPAAAELLPIRQLLKDSYESSAAKNLPNGTFPAGEPGRFIDYIFYGDAGRRLEPKRVEVPVEALYSDHLPLIVEFQWGK